MEREKGEASVGAVVLKATGGACWVDGAVNENRPIPTRGGAGVGWMEKEAIEAHAGRGGMLCEVCKNVTDGCCVGFAFAGEGVAGLADYISAVRKFL